MKSCTMSARFTNPLCATSMATDRQPPPLSPPLGLNCRSVEVDLSSEKVGNVAMWDAASNVAQEPANGSRIVNCPLHWSRAMLQSVKEAMGHSGVVVMQILVLGA